MIFTLRILAIVALLTGTVLCVSSCAPTYEPMTLKIRNSTTRQPIHDATVLVRQDQFFLPFPPYETLPFSLTTFQRPGKTAYGKTDSKGEVALEQVTTGPAYIVVLTNSGEPQAFYADSAVRDTWSPMHGTVLPSLYEIRVIRPDQSAPRQPSLLPEPAPLHEPDPKPVAEEPAKQPAITPTGW